MSDDECIFCSILTDKAPATFVYRDEHCAALMDIRPVTRGHVVVFPVTHTSSLAKLDAELAAHLMRVAHVIAAAQRKSGLRCEGVTLLLTDGVAAGQEVFHTHLHVFPRYRLDGFGLSFGPDYAHRPRTELETAAFALRPHIPSIIKKPSE
jgi:histidine triad (HIT) family protein